MVFCDISWIMVHILEVKGKFGLKKLTTDVLVNKSRRKLQAEIL